MKNKIRFLITTLFFFFTTQIHSNPIEKINFIGLINSSESALIDALPLKIGENYTNTKSNEIINSLFETGLFSDIKVVKDNNSLNINVVENPYIKYFEPSLDSELTWKNFLNPVEPIFTKEELIEFASLVSVSSGEIHTNQKISEFVDSLEKKYFEQGFFNAEITVNSEVDIQNRIGIDMNIIQGERARINKLEIIGSSVFEKKELLSLFKIGEPDFALINYFTNKDDFSDSELRNGLDKISNKYFNSGYLDFKIINVATNLNENKDKMSIIVEVSEGIQYRLGSISFSGELGNQSDEKLLESLEIKTGDVFNRSLIMADIQTITDIYADQGYAFVDIRPTTSDFLDTVNVSIEISLNKKIYVNRITISGNTRTQDTVIRRELKISEGGLYARSTLRESVNRLRRLGYFSDVNMVATEVENMPDKIDLNFIVEETKTGSISLSLSHSNSYGISLGAGIQEKNIFGSGNTLNTEAKFSESYNKISFYFENPNYNDKGHSTNIGVYISEINDNDIMADSYEISTKGASIGYGIPLTENTRINANLDYSTNDVKCGSAFSSAEYELTQCQSNDNDELSLKINWSESTLNDYLYPTKGRSNRVSLSVGTPIGDYEYLTINSNHTSYSEINEDITLKLAGSLDIANGYGGKELPFFKRFFGGGSGSVRGFGNKTLGPVYPNGKAKGGELSIFGSANLITPAFFFDNNEKMRLSAFIDTGNIYDKPSNLKLNELRMSAGIGFAYLSPIGAIGIYTSTPLIKKSGDIIENFGFSLGTGF